MAIHTELTDAPEWPSASRQSGPCGEASLRLGTATKALLTVVAASVFYFNAALMLNRGAEAAGSRYRLPVPFYAGKLFNLYPVFPSYETNNRTFTITGTRISGGDPVQLPLDSYMPLRQGELNLRMQGGSVANLEGESGRQRVLAVYARRLRERYNRLHRDAPLASVAISERTWPRCVYGYTHLAGAGHERILYAEPAAR